MKKLAILGSTGSIGRQTLNVVKRNKDKFSVVSISARSSATLFAEQVKEFSPKVATLEVASDKISVPDGTSIITGKDAYLKAIIEEADIVVVALVGFEGIKAVLKAIDMGKDIALATKEALVIGGELVMRKARERGVKITPIDSEHSAIWQALNFNLDTPFKRIILTASGGAFRDKSKEELQLVTANEALKHPNWNMGAKITVDCATMVNKAFEVIEAKWLYDADFSQIDAIIHRESIIHSLVEFNDNSVIAQMSYPTMEIPIALALDNSVRIPSNVAPLDLVSLGTLNFSAIDHERFPCFNLVVEAGKRGGLFPAVANGANEIAVSAFIDGKINFNDIFYIIQGSLNAYTKKEALSLEAIISADAFGRAFANAYINQK